MAKAEFMGENIAKIELCDNFMCSCRNGLGGREPNLLAIEKSDPASETVATKLHFSTPDGLVNTIEVPGVASRFDIEKAFEEDEGVIITGDGTYVCGAIDLLLRKRSYGR